MPKTKIKAKKVSGTVLKLNAVRPIRKMVANNIGNGWALRVVGSKGNYRLAGERQTNYRKNGELVTATVLTAFGPAYKTIVAATAAGENLYNVTPKQYRPKAA